MRVAGALAALLLGTLSASAQDSAAPVPAKPAAAKPVISKPAQSPTALKPATATASTLGAVTTPPNSPSPRDPYAGIPLAERIAIQSDLIWATDYNGLANGESNDRATAAIKAFQKNTKSKETGILNPQERAALAAAAKVKRDAVGWRMVDDPVGGARLGIPGTVVTQSARGTSGSRWTSAHGEVVVETFRVKEPGTTLAAVFEQQRKEPADRRVEYNVLKPDFFVVSGLQGLKKFYVRAQIKDGEVRGFTVSYDQAVEGQMEKVVVAMSSAFTPFADADKPAPLTGSPKRGVEYGTGIVASAAGHIATDRRLVDGCQMILIPSLGPADRLADDPASGLALLRVYGVRDLAPLALAETAAGPDATIVGIADPQTQAGGSAVSTASARLGSGNAMDSAPALGFSGAAAIDGQGRFLGMVQAQPQVLAGAEPASLPSAAALVPGGTVRDFLKAQGVPTASGRAGIDEAKASVVRVICVRK